MHTTQTDKLRDYLSGFSGLSATGTPVGAVLCRDEQQLADAEEVILEEKMGIVESEGRRAEVILEDLSHALRGGSVALVLRAPAPELMTALNNLPYGSTSFYPPGKQDMNVAILKGKLLVVMPDADYDGEPLLQEVVTSVCRL